MSSTLYINRDNYVKIRLMSGTSYHDLDDVTRVTLTLDGVTFDSNSLGLSDGGVFDISEGDGVLIMRLGSAAGLVAGEYTDGRLVIYSSEYLNGLVWSDRMKITVTT